MEVDARLLGRPRFTDNETEWSDWSFQARAYFDTVNPSMEDHLDAVETNSDRVIHLSTLGDVAVENARKDVLRTDDAVARTTFAFAEESGTRQRIRSLETAGGAL